LQRYYKLYNKTINKYPLLGEKYPPFGKCEQMPFKTTC